MRTPGRRTAGLIAAVALAAVAAAAYLYRPAPSAAVPAPDVSEAHTRVSARIAESRERVLDRPRDAERWGEFGMVLMAHQYRSEAASAFAEAARIEPAEFRWPYLSGYLKEESDLEEALRRYRKAAAIDPDRLPVRLRIGTALLQLGRLDDAETQFRIESTRTVSKPYALLGLARVSAARSDLPGARRHLEAAVDVPGWDPRPAYVELARVSRRLGDEQAASRAEEQAKRLPGTAAVEIPDPVLLEVEKRDVLGQALARRADFDSARGDFASAERSYRQLVRSRPDAPGPLLNLAGVVSKQGRTSEAVDLLATAVERFPDDVVARLRLADALSAAGDADAAEREYRRGLAMKPDSAEAWYGLGLILDSRGRADAAREAFEAAVAADGRHVRARVALGLLLNRTGDREAALSMLRGAAELSPSDPVPAEYLRQVMEGSASGIRVPEAAR